ncbi:hypothetical protein [Arthrobacter globiformis]|uniref:hypothetical protein n=1 Tax=Arthrobacter TaxID=1663 RepID=UPI002790B74A|nr:hypothetical protein [Arthrobacter globiformis]
MSRPPEDPSAPFADAGDGGVPEDQASAGTDPSGPVRPRAAAVISGIVAAEATALLGAAAWYGFQLASGAPVMSFWGAIFTLGLLLAFASWLYAVAVFLFRGFRWPRAGALVAQLFVLTIGFPTLTGGFPVAGAAMLIPAATAIVLLFDKRVIRFASRAASAPPAL